MSIDDFEPSEYEDDDYEGSSGGNSESLKDKYDKYKEKYEDYKEKYNKYKEKHGNNQSNEFQKPNTEQFRKTSGDVGNKFTEEGAKKLTSETTKDLGKNAVKESTKEVTKEAGKEVAKEAGKTVAKETGKAAAKEGTKAAVQGATSATGYGVIIAAAIEVADRAIKFLTDKEYREKTKENAKKTTIAIIAIIVGIFGFILMFVAAPLYVNSEEGTAALETIIAKREDRYTEDLHKDDKTKSVTKKTLMMFTNSEYRDLLVKNYDKIEGSKPTQYEDPSYKHSLKNDFGESLLGFFTTKEDLKNADDEYEVAANVVDNIVKAEKENFNKIDWYVTSGRNAYTFEKKQKFATIQEMESNDIKPTNSGVVSTSEVPSGHMQTIPHTELKIPKLSKYDIDPAVDNDTQKAYTYANAAQDYVQKWYIPYTMMIDTQDKDFVVNEVIGKMYHPIDFSLFEINRETKKTTVQYYLETTRIKYWEQWDETTTIDEKKIYKVTEKTLVDSEGNYIYDEDGNKIVSKTEEYKRTTESSTTTSSEKKTKSKDLGKSNTRDSKVGTELLWGEDSRTEKSNNREYVKTYKDNISIIETISETKNDETKYYKKQTYDKIVQYKTTIVETVKDKTRIETTLTDGGKIAKENGQPMVKEVIVTRSISPYRYIPKITHAETFYEIIDASYDIIPIDESSPPRTSEESELQVNWLKTHGEIVTTETWDESLTSGSYETNLYKVSYYSEADVEKLNRKISRVEWYQDWGDAEEILDNVSSGQTTVGSAQATSENMTKLLEQAEKMAQEQKWSYSMSVSNADSTLNRKICYNLEDVYRQKVFDCSSFVASLYNIYLGVSPGYNTDSYKTTAQNANSGFKMYTINHNNYSNLQLGDILYRSPTYVNGQRKPGHVGIYVGNGMQIDAGSGTIPKKQKVSTKYTHFIRYEGSDLSGAEAPTVDSSTTDSSTSTETKPSTERGIIYPSKTTEEKIAAYNTYGNSKGYSYDDMYFAFNQIEIRLSDVINQNANGSNTGFGGFMWPVEITESNPGTNVINCFFGFTPAYGENHTGIDVSRGNINVKEGSLTKGPYIVAAHDGTVTRATMNPTSDSDGYTFVNIQTTDGAYTTQYGHLSEIYVSTGDTVTKGQRIGRMGTTGQSTGVHLHFTVTDSSGGTRLDPLTFYNVAKASEPDTIINIADIDLRGITGIPTGYIYHSEKSFGEGFSVVGTVLSKDEWVKVALNYANNKSSADACFKNQSIMEKFYDTCVNKGVNPEYAFVTAITESNLRNSVNNYWGLATPNGESSASFGDMLTTLAKYCDTIVNYQDPASSKYSMIMARYEERKAVTENGGADPNGYGTPDTLQGIQSIYSYLGKHEYGSAGSGGYYYMDPSRAGVTKIYSTHDEFVQKCINGGAAHASGTATTPWEQAGYTAWQSEKKIEIAKQIFGEKAGTY